MTGSGSPTSCGAYLGKADNGLVRRYLEHVSGLSRAQMTRLIHQFRETRSIRDRRTRPARPFPCRYTDTDIRLLAEVDALHGTFSGPSTRKLCERAFKLFGDDRFERPAGISNGHLYNLRGYRLCQRRRAPPTTRAGLHRRALQAPPRWPSRLPACRFGPSGQPRRHQGPLPHQPR